jgi:hypothetical protein
VFKKKRENCKIEKEIKLRGLNYIFKKKRKKRNRFTWSINYIFEKKKKSSYM